MVMEVCFYVCTLWIFAGLFLVTYQLLRSLSCKIIVAIFGEMLIADFERKAAHILVAGMNFGE